MENASKALLIAAAVLIVILLIAFGMSIFNSTGDTSADAEATGQALLSQTSEAKIKSILGMMDLKDSKKFNEYIKENYTNKTLSATEVEEVIKLVALRSKKLTGKENAKPNITYISTWATIDGGGAVYWKNSLKKTLETIDENKKYKLKMHERKEYADMYSGKNVYSITIDYAD